MERCAAGRVGFLVDHSVCFIRFSRKKKADPSSGNEGILAVVHLQLLKYFILSSSLSTLLLQLVPRKSLH